MTDPAMTDPAMRCPCQSGEPFQGCCGRYLADANVHAPTAEALMRSIWAEAGASDVWSYRAAENPTQLKQVFSWLAIGPAVAVQVHRRDRPGRGVRS